MQYLAEPIRISYQSSLASLDDEDPYSGPGYLGIKDVLKAHYLIADHFFARGRGLGGIGPKDMNLLHSALHRQHVMFAGRRKWESNWDICATLFFGLIKDHPFYDANKRTAFLSLVYHLQKLNLVPIIGHRELEDFAVDVAKGNFRKSRRYQELERKCSDKADAQVNYISYFLKKHTRKLDKKYYTVTFRELKTILNSFGYDLQNPRGNTIDLVRIEERRKVFGILGEKEEVGVKGGSRNLISCFPWLICRFCGDERVGGTTDQVGKTVPDSGWRA